MKISIIIPCFNEKETIIDVLDKVKASDLGILAEKEIIVVDDGSTDGSSELLKLLISDDSIKTFYHEKNYGKGRALRTGFAEAEGDIIIVQDADLELDPKEYGSLLRPILDGEADIVYGSRFLSAHNKNIPLKTHVANKCLTILFNIIFATDLTDLETGYKVFRKSALEGINLKSDDFKIEAEITTKFIKRGNKIFEIPVDYNPRFKKSGKKMNYLWDGSKTVWSLLKYRFLD